MTDQDRVDAERWRAIAPTLRVKNVGFNLGAASTGEETTPPALAWRKTWLESKNPINGTVYSVEDYADALRTGRLRIVEDRE